MTADEKMQAAIRQIRTKRGLSLRALADLIGEGVSHKHISEYETGKRTVTLNYIRRLARACDYKLNISFVDLKKPKCKCDSARIESVNNGGVCPMGGCPYGGDF